MTYPNGESGAKSGLPEPAEVGPRWPKPGELWSLWDLMKYLGLPPFILLGHQIRWVRDQYWDDKERPKGFSAEGQRAYKELMEEMARACATLDAPDSVQFFKDKAEEEIPSSVDVYDVICDVFWGAMDKKEIFFLPRDRMAYFNPGFPPFGTDVSRKLGGSRDLESAGRCLAFGQPTAAVFHLMRAMEKAVGVMASRLGVENVEKEWGKLLADINAKVNQMDKGAERKRWNQACDNLWHVKEATRNEVMHPRHEGYSQEQGQDVWEQTKRFMKHLAELVPDPNPKPASPLKRPIKPTRK